jgi:hypothetical protein
VWARGELWCASGGGTGGGGPGAWPYSGAACWGERVIGDETGKSEKLALGTTGAVLQLACICMHRLLLAYRYLQAVTDTLRSWWLLVFEQSSTVMSFCGHVAVADRT